MGFYLNKMTILNSSSKSRSTMSKRVLILLVLLVTATTVYSQHQRCYIQCDTEESSYQSTLSTRQTRRQGPPGELYSDGEKLTALTLMFGEVENKLNIVRTSLCTSYTFSMTERTGSFDEVRTMCVDKGGDLVTAPFKRYGDQFIHGFRSVFN